MEISAKRSIVVPRPQNEVFEFCTQNDTFERTLRPLGPIAGVAKVELRDGDIVQTGAHRTITLTDGSVLEEEVLDYTPPERHQYRWKKGLKPPFSWLVHSGTGCWEFSPVNGGTQIEWSYVFELRSSLAYPIAFPIIALFERWLAQGLGNIASELEKRPPTATTYRADQARASNARPR
jgi:hypothetical protein